MVNEKHIYMVIIKSRNVASVVAYKVQIFFKWIFLDIKIHKWSIPTAILPINEVINEFNRNETMKNVRKRI